MIWDYLQWFQPLPVANYLYYYYCSSMVVVTEVAAAVGTDS